MPSVLPEVPKPRWRQLGVADRVLDVLVAEVLLDGPCVVTVVGELVSGRVAEHVGGAQGIQDRRSVLPGRQSF